MRPAISDRLLARAIADSLPTSAQREVNPRQLCVLLALTEGPLAINELRSALGLSVASASMWVSEASERGLVDVYQDENDKRRRIARLSAKGWVWARDRRPNRRRTDEDQHVDEREGRATESEEDLDSL